MSSGRFRITQRTNPDKALWVLPSGARVWGSEKEILDYCNSDSRPLILAQSGGAVLSGRYLMEKFRRDFTGSEAVKLAMMDSNIMAIEEPETEGEISERKWRPWTALWFLAIAFAAGWIFASDKKDQEINSLLETIRQEHTTVQVRIEEADAAVSEVIQKLPMDILDKIQLENRMSDMLKADKELYRAIPR